MNHSSAARVPVHPAIGTTEDLVRRAYELAPALRARAAETDALRRLPDATRADIVHTGIHRVLQPARFGGTESGFRAAVDILSAIGRGCGSTAWVLAQNIAHNFMLAQWPDQAQHDVWGENPAALLSGILMPGIGRARAVTDGYVLSGRWPWLSGVDICDWALFTAFVPDANGVQEDRHFVIPRHQFQIHDTWHAMGLRGSCSNDVTVDELFVPRASDRDGRGFEGWREQPRQCLQRGPGIQRAELRHVRRGDRQRRPGHRRGGRGTLSGPRAASHGRDVRRRGRRLCHAAREGGPGRQRHRRRAAADVCGLRRGNGDPGGGTPTR